MRPTAEASEEVNRRLPARNYRRTFIPYTDPEHHNAQRYRWTDRQTTVSCQEAVCTVCSSMIG